MFLEESVLTDFVKMSRNVAKIRFVGLKIVTQGSILQNIWAHAFYSAENCQKYVSINEHLRVYKNCVIPRPDLFDEIVTKTVNLYINKRSVWCNHQGLFLDWDCLYVNGKLRDRLESFFKSWLNHRPLGRIILFVSQEKYTSLMDDLKRQNYDFPIYYLSYSKNEDDFATPPSPGLLAYAQYLHNLNLTESIYVCKTAPLLSQNIGIGYVLMDQFVKLFQVNYGLIKRRLDYITSQYRLLPFLQDMIYCPELNDDSTIEERYPLVKKLMMESDPRVQIGNSFHGLIMNREHAKSYLVDNDFEDLFELYTSIEALKTREKSDHFPTGGTQDSLNTSITESEPKTPITIPKSQIPKNDPIIIIDDDEDDVPVVPTPKQIRFLPISPENPTKTSITVPKDPDLSKGTCIIRMSQRQIIHVFGILFFQRGTLIMQNKRVSDIVTKPVDSNSFRFYSKCRGSKDFHKQTALFQNGEFVKGRCSCQMGDDGKCKHIVAAILKSMQLNQLDNKEPIPFDEVSPDENWTVHVEILEKPKVSDHQNASVYRVVIRDCLGDKKTTSLCFPKESLEKFDQIQVGKVYLITRAVLNEQETHKDMNWELWVTNPTLILESRKTKSHETRDDELPHSKYQDCIPHPLDTTLDSQDPIVDWSHGIPTPTIISNPHINPQEFVSGSLDLDQDLPQEENTDTFEDLLEQLEPVPMDSIMTPLVQKPIVFSQEKEKNLSQNEELSKTMNELLGSGNLDEIQDKHFPISNSIEKLFFSNYEQFEKDME